MYFQILCRFYIILPVALFRSILDLGISNLSIWYYFSKIVLRFPIKRHQKYSVFPSKG